MPRLLFGLLVSILIAFAPASGAPGASAETLKLNNVASPPLSNDAGTGFLDVIAGEAFRRNGLELSLIKLPAERGLLNANAGIDDGELLRIGGMEKLYRNLVPVSEKLIDMHFVAFSKDSSIKIGAWRDLRNYTIGFIKGWKILEINTPKDTKIVFARDATQLFTMLEKGRIDIALYDRLMGLEIIRSRQIRGARDLAPPLAVRGMYIYLNKKHKALAPKLAASLADLKTEGVYDAEFQKIETRLGLTK